MVSVILQVASGLAVFDRDLMSSALSVGCVVKPWFREIHMAFSQREDPFLQGEIGLVPLSVETDYQS